MEHGQSVSPSGPVGSSRCPRSKAQAPQSSRNGHVCQRRGTRITCVAGNAVQPELARTGRLRRIFLTFRLRLTPCCSPRPGLMLPVRSWSCLRPMTSPSPATCSVFSCSVACVFLCLSVRAPAAAAAALMPSGTTARPAPHRACSRPVRCLWNVPWRGMAVSRAPACGSARVRRSARELGGRAGAHDRESARDSAMRGATMRPVSGTRRPWQGFERRRELAPCGAWLQPWSCKVRRACAASARQLAAQRHSLAHSPRFGERPGSGLRSPASSAWKCSHKASARTGTISAPPLRKAAATCSRMRCGHPATPAQLLCMSQRRHARGPRGHEFLRRDLEWPRGKAELVGPLPGECCRNQATKHIAHPTKH